MWSLVPLRNGEPLNDAIGIPFTNEIGRQELLETTWRACGCRLGRCDPCVWVKQWAISSLSRRALQLMSDSFILQIRGKTTRKLLRINGMRVNDEESLLNRDANSSWVPALSEPMQNGTILTFQSDEHPNAILEYRMDHSDESAEQVSTAQEQESRQELPDEAVDDADQKVVSLMNPPSAQGQSEDNGSKSINENVDSSLKRAAVETATSAESTRYRDIHTARHHHSFKAMRMEASLQTEASDGLNENDSHNVGTSLEMVDDGSVGGDFPNEEKSGQAASDVTATDMSKHCESNGSQRIHESQNFPCGLQAASSDCCDESSNDHESSGDEKMEDVTDDIALDEATQDKENQDWQTSAQCTQDLLEKISGDIDECERKWPANVQASWQQGAYNNSRNQPLIKECVMSTISSKYARVVSSVEDVQYDVAYSGACDKQSGGSEPESSNFEGSTQNAHATKKRRSGDGKKATPIASGSPEQGLSKTEPIELRLDGDDNAANLNVTDMRPESPLHPQFRVMFIKLGYSCSTQVLPFKVKQAIAKGATVVDLLEEKPTHLLIDPAVKAEKLAKTLNFGKSKRSIRNLIKYLDENEIVTVKVGDWIEGNDRLKPPTMKQLWYGLAPYRTKTLGQKRKLAQSFKLKHQPQHQELQSFASNDAIGLMFHKLAKLHQECSLMKNDEFRALTDNLISGRVKHLDFEITAHNLDRVKNIKGIGKSSVDKMKEFFQRGDGSCNRIKEFEKDKERMAVRAMQNIWGVGIKGAQQLMRLGYETIDQIRNDLDAGILEQKFRLNSNQRIGIKYYEDFLEKMTRKEVEQIADIVKEATLERFPKANITIMGSYRRGKETCGDIDLLITEPSYSKVTPPGALGELVSRLAERGHLSFHLTPNLEGMNNGATESQSSYDYSQESMLPPPNPTGGKPSSSSYMGVFCSPVVPGKMRRIDIKFYPYRERVFAALYFTGNGWFNRSMRRWASSKNFSMDDHGLFPVARNQRTGPKIKSSVFYPSTERAVFDRLGIVYKEPRDRNYFDDVIPLDESVNDWDPHSMTETELMRDVAAHSGPWID